MIKIYYKFIYKIYKKTRNILQSKYLLIKDIDVDFWEEVLDL